MPRLAAFIVLAGIAWATITRRRPAPVEAVEPLDRFTTFDGLDLVLMSSLSNTVH